MMAYITSNWKLPIRHSRQTPIPNPQSPIPNPQSPIPKNFLNIIYTINKKEKNFLHKKFSE